MEHKKPDQLLIKLYQHHPEAYHHSFRVARYMSFLARFKQKPLKEIELGFQAGLFHDLGKLVVDQAILEKEGELSPSDREIISHHSRFGFYLLKPHHPELAQIIVAHHEFQPQSYPRKALRFKDPSIEEIAKDLAICDHYDALRSKRSYKPGPDEAALSPILVEIFGKPVLDYLKIFKAIGGESK